MIPHLPQTVEIVVRIAESPDIFNLGLAHGDPAAGRMPRDMALLEKGRRSGPHD